jgi:hypothetical protein
MEFYINLDFILITTMVYYGVKFVWGIYQDMQRMKKHLSGRDLSKMSVEEIQEELDERKFEEELENEAVDTIPVVVVHVKMFLEKEGDILLAYRDDGAFMAQGKTVEEVATHFHERFPEAVGYLIDKSAEEGYLIRGE